ncbi:MAG: glycosyltransferase family 39 protein [Candidatus Omnitrophica bacterium]|nr:glycosyltransferase family 39 protein [Candidatus Omnitrophota bacterium]
MSSAQNQTKADGGRLFLWAGWVLAAAAGFLFFVFLHKIPLWSSDEGRYGEIAREMWESRNFILPTFNYVDYMDKPVLAPIATALTYALLGVNALTTRLPLALAALAGLLMTYRVTQRMFNRLSAQSTAVILMTSLGYVLVGRFAVIDMLLTFFLSAALFCLMIAVTEQKRGYYYAAYALMGLTFLTKGLIGAVLPGLIMLSFLIWTRNLKEIRKMHLGWGILIFLAIVLPWILAILKQEPEFLEFFIYEQHFKRFATGSFGRSRPFWFFLPIFFIIGFPWSLFFPSAICKGLKVQNLKEKQVIRFLICWIAIIFIFFSIPKSKLPYYLVPVLVPFSILIGRLFSQWLDSPKEMKKPMGPAFERIWEVICVVCIIAPLGLAGYMFFGPKEPELEMIKHLLPWGTVVVVGGSAAALSFFVFGRRTAAFLSLSAMMYFGLTLAFAGMIVMSPLQSTYESAEIIQDMAGPDDLVAVYGSPDRFSDLPFHLQKRIVIVSTDRGTLDRESREPEHAEYNEGWFFNPYEFVQFFNTSDKRIFCLLETDRFQELQQLNLSKYSVLRNQNGTMLMINRKS